MSDTRQTDDDATLRFALIFSLNLSSKHTHSSKIECEEAAEELTQRLAGVDVRVLHGDMAQPARTRNIPRVLSRLNKALLEKARDSFRPVPTYASKVDADLLSSAQAPSPRCATRAARSSACSSASGVRSGLFYSKSLDIHLPEMCDRLRERERERERELVSVFVCDRSRPTWRRADSPCSGASREETRFFMSVPRHVGERAFGKASRSFSRVSLVVRRAHDRLSPRERKRKPARK